MGCSVRRYSTATKRERYLHNCNNQSQRCISIITRCTSYNRDTLIGRCESMRVFENGIERLDVGRLHSLSLASFFKPLLNPVDSRLSSQHLDIDSNDINYLIISCITLGDRHLSFWTFCFQLYLSCFSDGQQPIRLLTDSRLAVNVLLLFLSLYV